MPNFKKAYKKLHANRKLKVDDAIRDIVANPKIGQEKKGDLVGVFVYKFKIYHQEMLLAYEWYLSDRLLLALGMHENFYRDLKKRRQ
ncbi:MAG: type II toxin-antitoxin system RelE/ParE family toxin [Gammaproteobacteria bacterium]|nr:type II toxin-antitoxin system RelE/ParE family toxin [Gammaproteobacteria bacterium]